jgi:hypothetical protein
MTPRSVDLDTMTPWDRQEFEALHRHAFNYASSLTDPYRAEVYAGWFAAEHYESPEYANHTHPDSQAALREIMEAAY